MTGNEVAGPHPTPNAAAITEQLFRRGITTIVFGEEPLGETLVTLYWADGEIDRATVAYRGPGEGTVWGEPHEGKVT